MTRKKTIILAIIAAVILLFGILMWMLFKKPSNTASDPEVYTTRVSLLSTSSSGIVNRFAGVVEPQKTVKIQKATDRQVKELFVKEGDTVSKGTPLFSYDVDEMQLKLSSAELEFERITNEIATLNDQIKLLQSEKEKAPESEIFSYTTQILTAQNDVKRAEYNQKSKAVEIEQIRKSMDNTTVTSEIDGVVKSINDGSSTNYYDDGTDTAYITILSKNEYRIKGTINEQNMSSISVGQPMIIHSRVDETLAWTGTVTEIDTESPVNSNSNMYMSSNDNSNVSSSYNFYVEINETAPLMLGQHVFMEPDVGQNTVKEGLWLPSYYICLDEKEPYVWATDKKERLEKRTISLGNYDETTDEYEIVSGLSPEDFIAFPEETLEEGMNCSMFSGSSEDMSDGASGDMIQ